MTKNKLLDFESLKVFFHKSTTYVKFIHCIWRVLLQCFWVVCPGCQRPPCLVCMLHWPIHWWPLQGYNYLYHLVLLHSSANSCTLNPDPCACKLINNPNIMPGRDESAHLSVTTMLHFSGVKTTSVDCCYAVVIKEILLSYSHPCKPGSFYHKPGKLCAIWFSTVI